MIRTLIAAAVAAAFALPLTSQASDNATNKQEGANPPGQASPGAPRSSTSGMDRDTGAAKHTNPTGKGSAGATSNRGRFEALDRNHDGYISRDEAKDAAELNTRFSELDANNDGKLSHDEYSAHSSNARGGAGATSSASGKKSKAGSGQPEGGGTSSTTK